MKAKEKDGQTHLAENEEHNHSNDVEDTQLKDVRHTKRGNRASGI